MSVPTAEPPTVRSRYFEERWAKMRSHKRAVASLRFLVEWEEGNKHHSAHAVTVDVSHSGCMAVVGADLPLHRKVRLVLPEYGRSAQGEVVWRGHEAWDIGIALSKPDGSFWGVPI
ncbi:MAG TPA: PilZ domain-containing protein [Candidatus Eremiobacteraceae bacterium]|nr:PilZ domain-containing protein [Candidatus Eremiobacteraceae bacterium]